MQMHVTFDSLKTFYNILAQKIKGLRGNWNQNDPNADDYIENRPFYSEVKDVVVLPKTTVSVDSAGQENHNPFRISLVKGVTYTVVFDGKTYECVAKETYENEVSIGNSSILGWNDNKDTGEPFFIDVYTGEDFSEVCFATNTSGTHTISVSAIQEVVHKLDKKFVDMPENVVTPDELAQVAFDGDYNSLSNTPDIYTDVVRYDVSQYLSETQKRAARTNIDTYSKFEIDTNYTQFKRHEIKFPRVGAWKSVTYGNGKFVAINNNRAVYSEDGFFWHETVLPSSGGWESVTYGNGKFVVVSNYNIAAYSEDGTTWTIATLPISKNWKSVTYGNGKFVAVASSSDKAVYSEDGITWNEATLPVSTGWYSVTYGDGKFVAVARLSNKAAYSEDGITWNESTLHASTYWEFVMHGNGKFIAVNSNANTLSYSEDGITWNGATLPVSTGWYNSMAYGNGKFVTIASNKVAYSEDGITWNETTFPMSSGSPLICYGNDKFVAIVPSSDYAFYSKDGITWESYYNYLTQGGITITPEVLGFKEPDLTDYATKSQVNDAMEFVVEELKHNGNIGYMETTSMTYDGNEDGREIIEMDETFKLVRVGDYIDLSTVTEINGAMGEEKISVTSKDMVLENMSGDSIQAIIVDVGFDSPIALVIAIKESIPPLDSPGTYVISTTEFGPPAYITEVVIGNPVSINPKYLPEGGFGHSEGKNRILFESHNLTLDDQDAYNTSTVTVDFSIGLEEGKKYKVTLDSGTYTTICRRGEGGLFLGNFIKNQDGSVEDHFLVAEIFSDDKTTVIDRDKGSNITVSEVETIHAINSKYIYKDIDLDAYSVVGEDKSGSLNNLILFIYVGIKAISDKTMHTELCTIDEGFWKDVNIDRALRLKLSIDQIIPGTFVNIPNPQIFNDANGVIGLSFSCLIKEPTTDVAHFISVNILKGEDNKTQVTLCVGNNPMQ